MWLICMRATHKSARPLRSENLAIEADDPSIGSVFSVETLRHGEHRGVELPSQLHGAPETAEACTLGSEVTHPGDSDLCQQLRAPSSWGAGGCMTRLGRSASALNPRLPRTSLRQLSAPPRRV